MNLFLAVDIGSSFVKAALFDLDKDSILEQIKLHSPTKDKVDDQNKYEVKVSLYLDLVKQVLETFTSKYKDIKGLLLSTQQHGFVYDYGEECKYISWQDQRCIEVCSENKTYLDILRESIPRDYMVPCGVDFKPSLGICNLYTLLQQDSSIKRDGELYTLGSYIYKYLVGKNIAHPQNLTQLGIYKVKEKEYSQELLKALSLDQIKLPKIAMSDTDIVAVLEIGNQKINVYPDFGDVQISALGAGLPNDGALINIATAAQVLVPTVEFTTGNFETRPYFDNSYIKVISNMPAGRNIDVFVNSIVRSMHDIYGIQIDKVFVFEQIHRLLKNTDISSLEIDPRVYATGDHISGGSIQGITSSNFNIANLFISLFKSMANRYIDTIATLCDLSKISKIVCAGGVSWRLPELLKEIEKASNRHCSLSLMEDEALNGMLMVAKKCFKSNQ